MSNMYTVDMLLKRVVNIMTVLLRLYTNEIKRKSL